MAKKKARTHPADTEPADEFLARPRRHWEDAVRREKQRGPKNEITPLDVTDLDMAPILRATDEFLEAYADYQKLAEGPGRDNLTYGDQRGWVWATARGRRRALDAAGVSGMLQGAHRKVSGIVALSRGVRQLLDAVELPRSSRSASAPAATSSRR